jgi:hypothetical protein
MRYSREERLRELRKERDRETERSAEELYKALLDGERVERISGNLFYHTAPDLFEKKSSELLASAAKKCAEGGNACASFSGTRYTGNSGSKTSTE